MQSSQAEKQRTPFALSFSAAIFWLSFHQAPICRNTLSLTDPQTFLPRPYENKMKRTSLNQSDDSRPSDRANVRPRKAARTNEPESSTDKSDTDKATAPNASTPMSSHDMQDIMKAVNDLLKTERKEWDEMKASLESSQEGIRVEMTKIQERLDKIQKCQGRQEAAIKALKQTEEELSKAIEPSNEQSQAPHVGTSLAERDTRQHLQGETDGEAVSGQTIASRLATTESEESTAPPR